MTILTDTLWETKYRPKDLSEYVFHDDNLKKNVEKWVAEKQIPNLLLSGVQGSGKTSLSLILVDALELDPLDVIQVNAYDENDVEMMRTKIKSFISTYAMGSFKLVRLEEADRLSLQAQDALKAMMYDYLDVARFIFTTNHENRITPTLKSRFQHFRFAKPNVVDVTEYACSVLIAEKVKFTIDLLDKFVAMAYPDSRKIVNLLQQNTYNGVLQPPQTGSGEAGDYKFAMLELLECGSWNDIRKLACAEVATEEWDDVYRFLYENLHKCPSFSIKEKWESGIVVIADHLYKHGMSADPEINAAAMFIRLGQI